MDVADPAGRQFFAVVIDDAHLRLAQRPPDRPGSRQPFVRVDQRGDAELAGGIGLADHRPEPRDHRALDVGCERRAGGGDEAQRRQVVAVAHRFGQRQHRTHIVGTR